MRRLLPLCLLLAGCGSTVAVGTSSTAGRANNSAQAGTTASTSATGTTPLVTGLAATPRGGSASGVQATTAKARALAPAALPTSAVTTPISLGFMSFTSAAQSVGVQNGSTFTVQDVEKTLVAQLNAQGGLAGRRIEPVYANVDGSSNDYTSSLQAACSTMTQDHHVAAVLGVIGFYQDGFENCLNQAGVPHLSGDFVTGDETSLRQYPMLVTTSAVSVDRRLAAQLSVLQQRGLLPRGTRLGVGLESCPSEQRAYSRTLLPTAQRLGITLAATSSFSCLNGIGNASNTASGSAAAVLKFQSARVDTVLFVSYDPSALLFFIKAADQQAYRPSYLVSSTDTTRVLEPNLSSDDLARFHGLGWLPDLDVLAQQRTTQSDRCLTLLARGGLHPQSALDLFDAKSVCDSVFLYQQALQATRGSSDPTSMLHAITALRAGYIGAATLDGRTSYDDRRDGPQQAEVFGYNQRCQCLAYAGQPTRF